MTKINAPRPMQLMLLLSPYSGANPQILNAQRTTDFDASLSMGKYTLPLDEPITP